MGVNVNCFCAVKEGPLESVTTTVNVELSGGEVVNVGVPVISPVVTIRFNPAGSDPDEMLHVKGGVPPVTANIWS